MFMFRNLSKACFALFLLSSCSSGSKTSKGTGKWYPTKNPVSQGSLQLASNLQSFDTCDAVHSHMQNLALEALEKNKDWQLDYIKLNHQQRPVMEPMVMESESFNSDEMADSAGGASESMKGPEEYTSTNNQVQGIEESDFIKNTGTHIFQISGNKIHIVQSWPADSMKIISSLDVEGSPYKLLLNGENQLIVLAFAPLEQDKGFNLDSPSIEPYYYYPYNRQKTLVHLLNVGDKEAPVVENSYEVKGNISHARRIGDTLRLISSQSYSYFPSEVQLNPYSILYNYDLSLDAKLKMINENYEKNVATIKNLPLDNWFSSSHLAKKVGEADVEINDAICKKIHSPQFSTQGGLTRIVSIHTKNLTIDEELLLSYVQDLYMSHKNLYLITPYYSWWHSDASSKTYIHKFSIESEDSSSYFGSGSVLGTPINQFALDEYEDHLRIATTVNNNIFETKEENGISYSRWLRSETYNKVFVLAQADDGLAIVGETDNLAEDERIYSVRYKGPWAYMVTFRQIDPLFTINLEDPSNPHMVGELKIPGFSSYIHFLDDNHLLTVGRGGDMEGRISGIKISVFDVTDKKNPVESAGYTIDANGWEWSDALFDHKAFTFYPSKSLLAIPVASHSSVSKLEIFNVAHDAVTKKGSVDLTKTLEDKIGRAHV